jgi:hypothetical protein
MHPAPVVRRAPRVLPRLLARLLLAAPALATAERVHAQFVAPKTVPVHQGEQFSIFPSDRAAMGGVLIAVDDTLADPFVNPAKAARVRGTTLFGAPYFHSVSGNRGGGRTVPVGGFASGGGWSGAAVMAIQQLDRAGPVWNRPNSERNALNRYSALSLARRLPGGLAVGASVFRAALDAVDGVDLLYAGSDRIDQAGRSLDVRVGAIKSWEGNRTLEVLLLHDRYDMTHDVHFTTFGWDPVARRQIRTERDEHNVDRTHTWGAHAEYVRPVGTEGWRVGALATANRLSHPKIPNYVIMNIPRDPGTTYGFNLGVGAAKLAAGNSLAIDLVHEPIVSETWADAAADTATARGGVIRAGGRTVENRFRFSNVVMRMGLGRELGVSADSSRAFGLRLGLAAHAIDYRLRQQNHVQGTRRTQDERWVEWTPTFGLRLRARDLDLRYTYRRTCISSGCVGAMGDEVTISAPDVATRGGVVIAAPAAPLQFESGVARAHQILVSVPLR